MMTTRMTTVPNRDDENLVNASLAGNRDAFGEIVARYQSLVCSLAFSATGSKSQSEDLAQEVFLTAWKQLPGLRDGGKLRGWLCGIARHLIHNTLREQRREPSHRAESLDEIRDACAPGPLPADQAISNEEAAILWQALERIPANYREPLILFYRENQSIDAVALNLDLTEDAVKQRLSRGRKLLQGQVLAFVEGALRKTAPDKFLTAAVMAAVSWTATSTKAAALGTTAAKAGSATKLGAGAGPAVGLLGALGSFYFLFKSGVGGARTPRERRFMVRFFWLQAVFIWTPAALAVAWLSSGPTVIDKRVLIAGFMLALIALMFLAGRLANHHRRRILAEDGMPEKPLTPAERANQLAMARLHGSKATAFLYLGMTCNMGGMAAVQIHHTWTGGSGNPWLLFFSVGLTLVSAFQAWRWRPRTLTFGRG